jgi:hypothetical protein
MKQNLQGIFKFLQTLFIQQWLGKKFDLLGQL